MHLRARLEFVAISLDQLDHLLLSHVAKTVTKCLLDYLT